MRKYRDIKLNTEMEMEDELDFEDDFDFEFKDADEMNQEITLDEGTEDAVEDYYVEFDVVCYYLDAAVEQEK